MQKLLSEVESFLASQELLPPPSPKQASGYSAKENKIGCLKGAGFLLFIAVLVFPRPGQAASAREAVRQGNRLYEQGKFADSLKMYEEALDKAPESDIVNFNAGTALYKQKRYDGAVDHFQKAILSDDASLRERAYYNLGNSFYKSGIEKEKTGINAAITALRESLRHLASALALDKKDQDAQYNYDFVNKELERLREKQQRQQQQQSQQNQDGQKDQGQQQDQQPGQGQSGTQQQSQPENQPQQPQGQDDQSPAEQSPKDQSSGEKSDGSRPPAAAQGQEQQQAESAGAHGQELTKSEAERLLQNYQQTEEPQGLLHVFKERHETAPVLKDW